MTIVGLTGGVGTGKSTVAGYFKELGAYVVDFDELAREVIRPRAKAWKDIVGHFGKGILNDDLTVNRRKLAEIVFCDSKELAKLNEIVHPEVFREDEKITKQITKADSGALIVKDVPLFFEIGRRPRVDKVVVVSASEQTRLRRLEAKGISRRDAENRIRSQLSLEEKVKLADFAIDNDGSHEETRRQVEEIYPLLKGRGSVESRDKRRDSQESDGQ
jgi:dephospho-CoA kinase